MRKRNNKLRLSKPSATNIFGLSSFITLAALGYVLLTPRLMDTVSAVDIPAYCKGDNGYVECDASGTVATYAHVASVVSLGVQSNVVMDVVPKSTGVITQTPVSLRVSTNSPEGYSLYMKTMGETNALTNMNGSDSRINPIEGQVSVPDMSNQDNVWGYSIGSNGSSDSDSDTNRIYQAVPMSQDQAVYRVDHLVEDGGDDVVDLSFASNITTSLPAGTYSNSVLISAVANPVTITNLSELVFMQDMSTDICANTAYDASGTMDVTSADIANPVTKQLIDTRDGKKYWVSKLADGNCWMVQNLALNLGTAPDAETEAKLGKFVSKLTPSDSDVATVRTPEMSTNEVLLTGTSVGSSINQSWGWQKAVITQPISRQTCGTPFYSNDILGEKCKTGIVVDVFTDEWSPIFSAQNGNVTYDATTNTLSTTPSPTGNSLIAVDTNTKTYDAHYLIGNYYQYNAATANTADGISSHGTEITESICPKGWKLPTSGRDAAESSTLAAAPIANNNDFYHLFSAYGYPNSSEYQLLPEDSESYYLAGPYTPLIDDKQNSSANIGAYPMAFANSSYVTPGNGVLTSFGNSIAVWSNTIHSTKRAYYLNAWGQKVFPAYDNGWNLGFSVRCLAR